MKVYIAGPMRGYPEFNMHAFNDAEKLLETHGFLCFNPVKIDKEHGLDLNGTNGILEDLNLTPDDVKAIVKRDIDAILECDCIYLLHGWRDSIGAQAEQAVAKWLGLEEFEEGDELPVVTV